MQSNVSQSQLLPNEYFAQISNQIDDITVGHPEKKNTFCKHIEKVIREVEKYRRYLRDRWRKAQKAGWTQYDANKMEPEWFLWSSLTWWEHNGFYFSDDDWPHVYFYIKGKPKPDPFSYLYSMIWGSFGQVYKGLELLDYQFILLAIIHDEQNLHAGQERIYFNPLQNNTLSDKLCRTVWGRLKRYQNSYDFRDVQQTIKTAMLAVRTELDSENEVDVNKPHEKDGQGNGGNAGDRKQGAPETTEPKVKPIRDQVFICYSHKDNRCLDELQIHLKPYVRNGSITAWSDEQIAPGSKWLPEIKMALARTKVAILLVTPNFLASEFIHEHELTPLLKEAENGDVCIIWIPVRACSYKETPLKDYQAAFDPEKPLAKIKKADRDEAWVRICEEIKKAVNR